MARSSALCTLQHAPLVCELPQDMLRSLPASRCNEACESCMAQAHTKPCPLVCVPHLGILAGCIGTLGLKSCSPTFNQVDHCLCDNTFTLSLGRSFPQVVTEIPRRAKGPLFCTCFPHDSNPALNSGITRPPHARASGSCIDAVPGSQKDISNHRSRHWPTTGRNGYFLEQLEG